MGGGREEGREGGRRKFMRQMLLEARCHFAIGPWPGYPSLTSARARLPCCIWITGAATAMRCCLPLLAVVWGVVFLVEIWFPSRGQRGRAHARKHACARGSFRVAVLFVWLLGTRIWARA